MKGKHYQHAIEKWKHIVGCDNVHTDEKTLNIYELSTFDVERNIPAVVMPRNTEEVSSCIEVANHYKIPVYPISCGKNWGNGSAVPTQDGSVIFDLQKMDRVKKYNDDLGYVVVEPGVTQKKLMSFLKGSKYFLNFTGSTPSSSVVGNILERGDGMGPYGERFQYAANFEVVLASGKVIRTGFGGIRNTQLAHADKYGVGPVLDGIFTQSNFGIITEATIWLYPIPKRFSSIVVIIDEDSQFKDYIDNLRTLKMSQAIKGNIVIFNNIRAAMTKEYYPNDIMNAGGNFKEWIRSFCKKNGCGKWNSFIYLYNYNWLDQYLDYHHIKKTVKSSVRSLVHNSALLNFIRKYFNFPYKLLKGVDLRKLLTVNISKEYLSLVPSKSLNSMYWKKYNKPADADDYDPNRDQCGFVWLSFSVPFKGDAILEAVNVIEDLVFSYQFEPSISISITNERSVRVHLMIVYNREVELENEKAMNCHDVVSTRLNEMGYFPSRLGVQSMHQMSNFCEESKEFKNQIKMAVDPNNIISPDRYSGT